MVCLIITIFIILTAPFVGSIVYRINYTNSSKSSPFSLFWFICICLCSLIILKYMSEVFVYRIEVNQAGIRKLFGTIIKVDREPGLYMKFLN